ncbi:hypothetical protein [Microbacterium atlanticum]|uniref:hypothetical protein n=1 Tax=Microbacterium atlanticum TaxID=2782168 RepID=UPI001888FDBC|nr:hypothetical protein [Microbacterium atlanticum]
MVEILDNSASSATEASRRGLAEAVAEAAEWRLFDSQLSVSAALEAGFNVGQISAGYQARVIVRELSKSVEKDVANGVERWGTAIRLVIVAESKSFDGQLSVPMVTAKAELSQLSARCELLLRGVDENDNKPFELIPDLNTLSVETLPKYSEAMDAIRKYLGKTPGAIKPARLSTILRSDQEQILLKNAAAKLMMLAGLLDGYSGSRYYSRIDNEALRRRVADEWASFDPASANDQRPSAEAVRRADLLYRAAYS